MRKDKNFDRNNRNMDNKKQQLNVNANLEFANENDAQFFTDNNQDKNNKDVKFNKK
ncbi:hypothetical protein [Bacillus sp. TL12]|uniref:hypothetical protein n=1 Tax=Bacillus sp. TL12 TaxID=2894756 RepID=UPI001F524801|nr:hypothetical protein [Bacillus sp. TL12]MCI0764090.1 hypothetical protein [Bacillus sp. TL12]